MESLDVERLRSEFNKASDAVRLIVVLSPT